ncbi:MAG: hypothetical protein C0615_08880 [Desulfuromonas sp.]|nr:MAG: hypothetical protein C0615_08880 [Desulfuromonas sp.]
MFKFLNCFFFGYLLLCSIAFAEIDSETCVFPDAPDVQAPDWICTEIWSSGSADVVVGVAESRAAAIFDALHLLVQAEKIYVEERVTTIFDESEAEIAARQARQAEAFWKEMQKQGLVSEKEEITPPESNPQEPLSEKFIKETWEKAFGAKLSVQGRWQEYQTKRSEEDFDNTSELIREVVFRQDSCEITMRQAASYYFSSGKKALDDFVDSWEIVKNCDMKIFFEHLPSLGMELVAESISPGGSQYVAYKRNSNWPKEKE